VSFWAQTRDEAGVKPRVACTQKFGNGLRAEVMDLAGRYQDILIDAGGRDSVKLRAALGCGGAGLHPIQASQFDVWTLSRVNELVKTARAFNAGLRAFIVLSRISPKRAEAEEAIRDFEHLELSQSVIRDRIAYRKAARECRP
jgi:chromosome partitioning protein